MLIDCDTCRARDVECGDCVINLLLGAPQDSRDLDADEAAALGALAAGGLAPPLRLVPISRYQPPDVRWQPLHSADEQFRREQTPRPNLRAIPPAAAGL